MKENNLDDKRKPFSITVEGITDTFANTCRRYNVPYVKAYKRLSLRWEVRRIFELEEGNNVES